MRIFLRNQTPVCAFYTHAGEDTNTAYEHAAAGSGQGHRYADVLVDQRHKPEIAVAT
ncbi:MAG: hypothetical protein J0G34_10870 [Afipia sp.]|nr:hypothetical protein [Afipia sp.]